MPLHVKSVDVPERKVVRTGVEGEGAMIVRRGYGNECSLMWATRAPGYHTTPHAHEAEQINYVLEGEIWFFVEERGFLCKTGDFQRIPGHKIHWAWNRSSSDAVVVEGRVFGVRYFEHRTGRGQRRYSAEITLDATDRVILDADSMVRLEARATRVAPATFYSRLLAKATAA